MNFKELSADEKLFNLAIRIYIRNFKIIKAIETDMGGKLKVDRFLIALANGAFKDLDTEVVCRLYEYTKKRGLCDYSDCEYSQLFAMFSAGRHEQQEMGK